MLVDVPAMQEIARRLYAVRIESIYGPAGIDALERLLAGVRSVHQAVAYEMVQSVTVFATLEGGSVPLALEDSQEIDYQQLGHLLMAGQTMTIEVLGDRVRVWSAAVESMDVLALGAVIYHFEHRDFFYLEGTLEPVLNPTQYPSVFGVPTFFDLDGALAQYRDVFVRLSVCEVLGECWTTRHRWLLINKPESKMRRSLTRHLRSTLRDAEVRPEQNMDETHPVDIKVTWSRANRIAIIEIKWMGDSVDVAGIRVSTPYGAARAVEGAVQLANYLDLNRPNAPLHVTQGYLVVIDARRRNVDVGTTTLSREDGFYYEAQEVAYPAAILERPDFARPLRAFVEPEVVAAA